MTVESSIARSDPAAGDTRETRAIDRGSLATHSPGG
jgi:hypothetical protein